MDSRVLQTQEWLNKTYGEVSGFPTVVEDGITGNATFRALIYALQLEIGISKPDGVFGNDTLNNCPTLRESLIPDSEIPRNIIYILQVQIPLHRITDSASNGSVFPVVTEHFSASSDHAFL